MTRSLSMMAACIRHVTTHAASDEIKDGLESAIATLQWLEKGELVLKMLIDMRKHDREMFDRLVDVLSVFPGSMLADIREVA